MNDKLIELWNRRLVAMRDLKNAGDSLEAAQNHFQAMQNGLNSIKQEFMELAMAQAFGDAAAPGERTVG